MSPLWRANGEDSSGSQFASVDCGVMKGHFRPLRGERMGRQFWQSVCICGVMKERKGGCYLDGERRDIVSCHTCSVQVPQNVMDGWHIAAHSAPDKNCLKHGRSFKCDAELKLHQSDSHVGTSVCKCPISAKIFFSNLDLKVHLKGKHGLGEMKSARFLAKRLNFLQSCLRFHVKMVHSTKLPCCICDKSFPEFQLKIHMQGNENGKLHICEQCNVVLGSAVAIP
ncbi:unnamed protein product [Cyprideis torosa]|uniref:Uncharacterized protein n=1 Tax=Cyprideis torosa TaxID=163714 RepID=A0A7R8WBL8_9CRUS|nr:unnamed protein product [Cyprideis torosa]CAG0886602.1 unnamed protein product [Cyprideis torosa]